MAADVQKLVLNRQSRPIARKKAALCLLRLYRRNPECIHSKTWSEAMFDLLDERDIGLLTAIMSLLIGLASNEPENYVECAPKVIKILERLAFPQQGADIKIEYTYYGIPSPWLQVKCMRVLQYFPVPSVSFISFFIIGNKFN